MSSAAMTDQPDALAAQPPDAAAKTVGDLMEPPLAVFLREQTVGEAIESIRELAKPRSSPIATSPEAGKLVGVVIDARPAVRDARDAARRRHADRRCSRFPRRHAARRRDEARGSTHYPVYPVVDAGGRLVGLVRGQAMFEEQAIEISAQAGTMVGVDKEERLATPWPPASSSATPGCSSTC